jgi:hypothetical protein
VCRNPVRRDGVTRAGDDGDRWFHADCWEAACAVEQDSYQQRVEESGLAALLAPYVGRRRQ